MGEYVGWLVDGGLVRQTKRQKVAEKKVEGFYSNRSKKEEISRRYLKRKEGPYRSGFRCDSDRKINIEEEDLPLRFRGK